MERARSGGGDIGGDTNEGDKRGAEAGMHALSFARALFFFPLCMTSTASAFHCRQFSYKGGVAEQRGGVRRLGHLALAFLRDVLSWLRWTRPGRARTSTWTSAAHSWPTEVSRDQPILFACVSHTSVYICLWPVIPDEETENEGSKMPEISKSVTIQNSLFGRVVANRIRRFLHPSSSSVSTSSGDGGWEVLLRTGPRPSNLFGRVCMASRVLCFDRCLRFTSPTDEHDTRSDDSEFRTDFHEPAYIFCGFSRLYMLSWCGP
ncbi:hypothetical protein B0H14DRAFT_222379 [Mycena olivaceomarginata]|nr:hypothetical protein B0H14DRAFT_222379 [Mycena olivaceomarginata]